MTPPRNATGAPPQGGAAGGPAAPGPQWPLDALAAALSPRKRFRQWWQSRLPHTDTWQLGQRNIYILPTRAGFTFAATMLVMLLASINYQLNLGFALTFLLTGAGIVSMHLTHGNLRGLTLHLKALQPGFVGDPVRLDVVLTNPGRERHGLALRFEDRQALGPADAWCDAPAGGQGQVQLSFAPARRGWHAVPVLVLETHFPFGLFRAWTVWRPASRALAWPQPEQPAPALPQSAAAPGDAHAHTHTAGSEMDGVRPWRRGDTMRQVAWKKVARSGELVSRDTAGTASRSLVLDWAEASGSNTEHRLQRLAAWVLQAHRDGLAFGLRLPGVELPPQDGDSQRRAALDALAQFAP